MVIRVLEKKLSMFFASKAAKPSGLCCLPKKATLCKHKALGTFCFNEPFVLKQSVSQRLLI